MNETISANNLIVDYELNLRIVDVHYWINEPRNYRVRRLLTVLIGVWKTKKRETS